MPEEASFLTNALMERRVARVARAGPSMARKTEVVGQDQIIIDAAEVVGGESADPRHITDGVEEEVPPAGEREEQMIDGDAAILLSFSVKESSHQPSTCEPCGEGADGKQDMEDATTENSYDEPVLKRQRVEQSHPVFRMQVVSVFPHACSWLFL